jgi:hypothetical protein
MKILPSFIIILFIMSSLLFQSNIVINGIEILSYQVDEGETRSYMLEEAKRNTGLEDEVGIPIPLNDKIYRILPISNVTVKIIEIVSNINISVSETWNTTDLIEKITLPNYFINGSCIIGFSIQENCENLTDWFMKPWPDQNDWSWVIPTINNKSYWENLVSKQNISEENHTIRYYFNEDTLIREEFRNTTLIEKYLEEYVKKEYNWKTGWLIYYNHTRLFNDVYGNWTPHISYVLSSLDPQKNVSQVIGFGLFTLSLSFILITLVINRKRKI